MATLRWGRDRHLSVQISSLYFVAIFTKQPIHQATNSPSNQFTRQPINQAANSPGSQLTRQPIHQAANSPGSQFTRQPIHQAASQLLVLCSLYSTPNYGIGGPWTPSYSTCTRTCLTYSTKFIVIIHRR